MNPRTKIAHLICQYAKELSLEEVWKLLSKPPEPSMGDYALPCFRLGGRDFALSLAKSLEESKNPWIEKAQALGAFCNIFLKTETLAQDVLPKLCLDQPWNEPTESQSRKIMIEFSQPNTHKEFHIGHGRNVSLGDSLARILRHQGHEVLSANYIGDEGTHVAKCLWAVARSSEELPTKHHSHWYGQKYVEANKDLKKEDQPEISNILTQIEEKKGPYFDLWMASRAGCLQDFQNIYNWLDVTFDHVFFESEVSCESQFIVDEYIKKGLFTLSDGAYGLSMEEWGLGYFMVRKSDGTGLYITKDLALARRKFEDFAIQESIYVVGNEQNFHFKQLFKALELMGFSNAQNCHHLSYAHVKLASGKMSSRSGDVISFLDLKQMIEQELSVYLAKYQGVWSQDKIDETLRRLTICAIKYGMLATDPQKEIVFDPKVWTNFEGNSGLYLMYVYSRTASILKKCKEEGFVFGLDTLNQLKDPWEHDLLSYLFDFPSVIEFAANQHKPSLICHHLYETSKAFNRFYAKASVINAAHDDVRKARMALTLSVSKTLEKGLFLLGMLVVDQM